MLERELYYFAVVPFLVVGTDPASHRRSCNCSFCFDYIYSCILLLCPATMCKAHLLCTLHHLPLFHPCNADPLVQRRRS
ncbi:hypothetical protein MRX96_049249 [Rhipicephalus microplus]